MKQEVPSYMIKYIQCAEQDHQGQKVNLICLNSQCHQNSLICSLCALKHRGHNYKPIKIYLDELYRKYQTGLHEQKQDIDQLQKRKLRLLHNLKVCVEKISQAFMNLEEDILLTYQKLKNQIHQNESRKSKFSQFYLSMIKDNYGDPHFQVKNYLHKQQINIFTEQNIFENLVKTVEKQVKNVRSNFINVQSLEKSVDVKPKDQDSKTGEFLTPKNITNASNFFTQTLFAANSPNLCLFNLDIGQWMGKLRVTVTSMQAGSKLTFGLMRKTEFQNAAQRYKQGGSSFYIDSAGKSQGSQYNHIGVIATSNAIDFFVKKNNFKITCKSNNAIMNLADKKYYFFFAMVGNCKIKITYPYYH